MGRLIFLRQNLSRTIFNFSKSKLRLCNIRGFIKFEIFCTLIWIPFETINICFFNARKRDKVGSTPRETTRMVGLFAMLSETSQAVDDTLCNIANKPTIRVVSRGVEPTLSRFRALKKQMLIVSKGIQIKVQKISNFIKPRILHSRSFDLEKLKIVRLRFWRKKIKRPTAVLPSLNPAQNAKKCENVFFLANYAMQNHISIV